MTALGGGTKRPTMRGKRSLCWQQRVDYEYEMGHQITALIGTRQGLGRLIEQFAPPAPTELSYGLIIVPLGELRLDLLTEQWSTAVPGFAYLNPGLELGVLAGIGEASVLYVETNYFGGTGSQSAAFFSHGQVLWRQSESVRPRLESRVTLLDRALGKFGIGTSKSPINRGLAELGVPASPGQDEFDDVGLGRFRSLEALGLYEWDDED